MGEAEGGDRVGGDALGVGLDEGGVMCGVTLAEDQGGVAEVVTELESMKAALHHPPPANAAWPGPADAPSMSFAAAPCAVSASASISK